LNHANICKLNPSWKDIKKKGCFLYKYKSTVEDNRGSPVYIKPPFKQKPDFGVTSVNYNIAELMKFKIDIIER